MDEKTFENFDKLNRKFFADKLIQAISTFSPFHYEAYVLSLNATFGSGKTTFLEMWRNDLEKQEYKVIHINAWETDFDDEPIIPIASTLMDALEGEDTETAKSVRETLSKALGFAGYILEKTTGFNAEDLEKKMEPNNLETQGKTISNTFFTKKGIYKSIRTALKNYSDQLAEQPLIILVDELDRVRPDYAVKFLEAIKHIFSVKGVCFILAVDRQQLEASVRQLYGEIDFDNYYLRFVTREVDLPEACTENLMPFIEKTAKEFFDKKSSSGNIAFVFKDEPQKREVIYHAAMICTGLGLRPRQIETLFRQYSQFMAVDNGGNEYLVSWMKAPILLIALNLSGKRDIYKQIKESKFNPQNCLDLINSFYFLEGSTESDIKKIKKHLLWDTLPFLFARYGNGQYIHRNEAAQLMRKFHKDYFGDDLSSEECLRTLDHVIFGHRPKSYSYNSQFQDFQKKLEGWENFLA